MEAPPTAWIDQHCSLHIPFEHLKKISLADSSKEEGANLLMKLNAQLTQVFHLAIMEIMVKEKEWCLGCNYWVKGKKWCMGWSCQVSVHCAGHSVTQMPSFHNFSYHEILAMPCGLHPLEGVEQALAACYKGVLNTSAEPCAFPLLSQCGGGKQGKFGNEGCFVGVTRTVAL